jgi:hypothetical protein
LTYDSLNDAGWPKKPSGDLVFTKLRFVNQNLRKNLFLFFDPHAEIPDNIAYSRAILISFVNFIAVLVVFALVCRLLRQELEPQQSFFLNVYLMSLDPFAISY